MSSPHVGYGLAMSTPQQPELARSERSAVSAKSVKARAGVDRPTEEGSTGPMPADSTPGHHPDVEQDKPQRRPRTPARHHKFSFRRDSLIDLAALPFGVTPANTYVDVDD